MTNPYYSIIIPLNFNQNIDVSDCKIDLLGMKISISK
jgi:hypothetical protein